MAVIEEKCKYSISDEERNSTKNIPDMPVCPMEQKSTGFILEVSAFFCLHYKQFTEKMQEKSIKNTIIFIIFYNIQKLTKICLNRRNILKNYLIVK